MSEYEILLKHLVDIRHAEIQNRSEAAFHFIDLETLLKRVIDRQEAILSRLANLERAAELA